MHVLFLHALNVSQQGSKATLDNQMQLLSDQFSGEAWTA